MVRMLREDYGDGHSEPARPVAIVRNWADQPIDTVREYFDTDFGRYAQVVVMGTVANVLLSDIILEVQ